MFVHHIHKQRAKPQVTADAECFAGEVGPTTLHNNEIMQTKAVPSFSSDSLDQQRRARALNFQHEAE